MMTATPATLATLKCAICNQTEAWHRQHKPKHAFTLSPGDLRMAEYTPEANVPQPPAKPSRPLLPSDPVLRKVLIDKGLITLDDIEAAEREIAALSGAFRDFQQGKRITVQNYDATSKPISQQEALASAFTLGDEDNDTAEEQVADTGTDGGKSSAKPRKGRKK